ncbi:MAG TPA: polysaccharide deacetylase family protein [Nitrospira sp.]|nr:polysaccharide deacetylase family protein [Nitrospira sp.]
MEFLKCRFRLLSAHEVGEIVCSRKEFPDRSCLITFDDGWKDNYTQAFPILQAFQAPAIIFLTTGYIGTSKRFWHDRLRSVLLALPLSCVDGKVTHRSIWRAASVNSVIREVSAIPVPFRRSVIEEITQAWKWFGDSEREQKIQEIELIAGMSSEATTPAMLSWEDVAVMAAGGIEFGSHTVSHVLLDQVSGEEMRAELRASKEVLEYRLKQPVEFVAYPNGNYNNEVLAASKECGYLAGFTCEVGSNVTSDRPFVLKRKHVLNELSIGWNGQFSETFFATELSGIRHAVKAGLGRK